MSKNMTRHAWEVTYLCRNVTIVCGASYHLLGSWISWDSKIRFRLQVESYISNRWFSESQHLARYVSCHNAMAYDRASYSQQAVLRVWYSQRMLRASYSRRLQLRVWYSQRHPSGNGQCQWRNGQQDVKQLRWATGRRWHDGRHNVIGPK